MATINNILLVVNPISGDLDKSDLIDQTEQICYKKKATLKIYKTSGNNDVNDIQTLVKDFQPDRVFIAGGDGTIKMVVEALHTFEFLTYAILPAGSANGLATDLKIPQQLNEALEVAFQAAKKLDIITINDQIGLHISDIGMNAELIEHYESSSIRGKLGYAIQAIPTLSNSDAPYHFTIETDHGIIERDAVMIAIANARAYGNGAIVNPIGKLDDGKFEVLIFKSLHILKILETLVDKAPLDNDFIEIISTTKATIACTTTVSFQIDGEYCGKLNKITAATTNYQIKIAY
ncbi:diacylglycerol/lipid kinase family protein [Zhouia sp. PK063]|uniref:diacylglycerol/lipid kinase family protein n=1 Tax=Zhouia sp. PK063 TaxID=3373602 RepID=UPI00378BBD04